MTRSGDEVAAVSADRSLLRASHADREQVIETLKAAFVQGRLAKDEFDARVGRAFTSRTYAELAAVKDDIPAGPTGAQPAPKPAGARVQPPENTRIRTSVRTVTAATALLASAWMSAWLAQIGNPVISVLLLSLTVALSGAWLVTGSVVLLESQQKRSRRQLPPRSTPGAGDQASGHPASPASAEHPPIDHGQQRTAEAASRRRPRPPLPPGGSRVHGVLRSWQTPQTC